MFRLAIFFLILCVGQLSYAKPLMILSDTLNEGEHYIGIHASSFKQKSNSEYLISGGITGSGSQKAELSLLELDYQYGVNNQAVLYISLPYHWSGKTVGEESYSTNQNFDVRSKWDGLGDLESIFSYSLLDNSVNKVSALVMVKLPVGSDKPGDSEVIENGIKRQDLIKGGASSGTTDYGAAFSYSKKIGRVEPFLDTTYTFNGSKTEEGEKIEPGDEYLVRLGISDHLSSKFSYFFAVGYTEKDRSKSGDFISNRHSRKTIQGRFLYEFEKSYWLEVEGTYGETSNIQAINTISDSITNSKRRMTQIVVGLTLEL